MTVSLMNMKDNSLRYQRVNQINTLGIGYDHANIIHYSVTDVFTRDGPDTIRAKDPTIPCTG
jgi:hypothetical protein